MDKILIMGLSQTGKTTIIKVITEGFVPQKKAKYTATIDYERKTHTIFGKEVSIFDLGGQKSFLDRFVGELAEFLFSNISSLVYIIDIEKVSKLSLAKYYLELALKNIKSYSPKANVSILLHKIDLIDQEKKDGFIKNFKSFINQGIDQKMHYYETSVFNNSIGVAFESIITKLTEKEKSFNSIIENYKLQLGNFIEKIVLLDEEGQNILRENEKLLDIRQNVIESFNKFKTMFNLHSKPEFSFHMVNSNLIFNSLLKNGFLLYIKLNTDQIDQNSELYKRILIEPILLEKELNKFIKS